VAVDMFLKLTPIKGESKDSKHKDEIDVLSWSWGASNTGSAQSGGGGGAGKVNAQDMSITKYVELASPPMWLAVHNGKHFDEAILYVRKAGETPLEYLTISMKKVFVTSITTGGSGGDDRPTENVTLNFAAVKIEYKEQTDTGASGVTGTMQYSYAHGKDEYSAT
jgi:type VI secretion system secreted protein Hcp